MGPPARPRGGLSADRPARLHRHDHALGHGLQRRAEIVSRGDRDGPAGRPRHGLAPGDEERRCVVLRPRHPDVPRRGIVHRQGTRGNRAGHTRLVASFHRKPPRQAGLGMDADPSACLRRLDVGALHHAGAALRLCTGCRTGHVQARRACRARPDDRPCERADGGRRFCRRCRGVRCADGGMAASLRRRTGRRDRRAHLEQDHEAPQPDPGAAAKLGDRKVRPGTPTATRRRPP